ncbi:MAG: IscS subfamily cysteine desulfurase [Desulfobacteraceae bacterium]|nr:IscS subfamily cysteine desulfurase [Desulfobacteraceae bacterium]
MKTETRDGLCGICPAGCWVRATIEGGRLVGVEPLPGHHLGTICTIGRHSPEIVYDPQRLRYPLRRTGPKGDYEFARISWDDAYGLIAERLQAIKAESGPEAAAVYTGRGSFDMALCDLFQPAGVAVSSASSVLFPFGSPNALGVGALCYVSFAMIAPHVTMGEMAITMDVDLEQAELIVLWGANPATDSPPLAHEQILRARARGAEVIAIDPRRGETAREAGAEWIPIRPGTDGALALGLIQVLLEEELYDENFARDWTVGFEELARLAQHYRPETVEAITTVPAATVRSLARRLARARGAAPVMYTGLEYSDSGVQAIRAVLVLWALAGQLDMPGGLLFRMKESLFPQNRSGLIANPDPKKALGRDRFPVYSLYRGESHAIALPRSVLEGDPYRVRALIIQGGSLITAWPDPALWRRTLGALDFLVTIDRYHTADSAYADLVLPAATGYETTSFMRYGPLFKIREKLIEPVGEARNDFLIMAGVADCLGYGHLYPRSEEAMLRHGLAGSGFTLEEVRTGGGSVRLPGAMMEYRKWEKGRLRPDGRPGFATPSGKFEIASSVLAEHGYDPLPVYTEPAEGPLGSPALAREFPLVLNSGARTPYDFRSQHHGVRKLAARHPEPLVTMNAADAAARGIADGDRVWVASPRGRVAMRARVTGDIASGTVDAAMGGGGPLGPPAWREANVNVLTDPERYDPISGFPIYKTLLCQVEKTEDGHGAGPPKGDAAPAEATAPLRPVARPERRVYLDHNATTPLAPEALAAMLPFYREECGNPSSIHGFGSRARGPVEAARRQLAQLLNCTARRLIFTAGGSEADNLALKGAARARRDRGLHLVTSGVEHPAVLASCRALAREGFEVTILPVGADGTVEPETLAAALRPDTILVSVMLANNETGAVQPIRDLARIAREGGALFHTDAVQGLGKIPIDVEELGVDLISVSAHKIHGPKGMGALYVRQGVVIEPLIHGGGQEWGLRAGTENVAGIVGFGKACELAQRRLAGGEAARQARLRDRLAAGVAGIVPGARVNGGEAPRLPNTLNMVLPGIRGESLVLLMDRHGIGFSSGSACKSGRPEPSPSLLAMGLSPEEAHCAVRFSLGPGNSDEEIDYVLAALKTALAEAHSSIRFVGCR